MKEIPYGKNNFKELIEKNCYYVDKTMYLEKLENNKDTLMYLRPGRFGKSLFTSMMFYYYDLNSKDLFESLFKETYVYANPTKNKNNYYVLKFDFSGLTTGDKNKKEIEEEFKGCIITGINNLCDNYNLKYNIDENKSVSLIIKYFLSYFKGLKLDHKLYILIDEYDNFTNAILEGEADRFKSAVGNGGFVKAFYAVLKEYIGLGVIDRFFATGICPITLNSMTTGFNIATNLSTDLEFNSMIGLTHEEVKKLLNDYVSKEDEEEIYNVMLENYDGYLFNKKAKEKIFNATLVVYLLDYYVRYKEMPEEIMDDNIVFNRGKVGNLIELKHNPYTKELLEEILLNDQVRGKLKRSFDLEIDFDRNDIISLLYYFGDLTIEPDKYGGYFFKIPNQVMKEVYGNYFIYKLNEIDIKYDSKKIEEIFDEIITKGTINNLCNYTSEILEKMDNRDYMQMNELIIKIVMFTLLINNEYYFVSDEQVSNNGYIDIYLRKKSELVKDNIIIELKYLKKEELSEKKIMEKLNEGTEQVKRYAEDERLGSCRKYVAIYSRHECLKLEEIV